MGSVKITAKRQATLPKALCDDMGLRAGDSVDVERRVVDGEEVWVLRPQRDPWSWVGGAREFAKGKSNDWEAVKESVSAARRRGG